MAAFAAVRARGAGGFLSAVFCEKGSRHVPDVSICLESPSAASHAVIGGRAQMFTSPVPASVEADYAAHVPPPPTPATQKITDQFAQPRHPPLACP